MWMSDKPLIQQQLANDLASLVEVVPFESALPFLDAFWKTMAREWNGIESLRYTHEFPMIMSSPLTASRMDKFLLLIRRYLNASFSLFAHRKWKDTQKISQYLDILSATPLNVFDHTIPNGLRYHVIDIYIDELDKVDTSRDDNLPLETMLAPLRDLGQKSPTKSVRQRCKEALEDERLQDWNASGTNATEETRPDSNKIDLKHAGDDEDEWEGIED
jgi:ribosomal RNA-processing protein 1